MHNIIYYYIFKSSLDIPFIFLEKFMTKGGKTHHFNDGMRTTPLGVYRETPTSDLGVMCFEYDDNKLIMTYALNYDSEKMPLEDFMDIWVKIIGEDPSEKMFKY